MPLTIPQLDENLSALAQGVQDGTLTIEPRPGGNTDADIANWALARHLTRWLDSLKETDSVK